MAPEHALAVRESGLQQLPLPLVDQPVQRLDNYLPGPNAAVLAQLRLALPPRAPLFLWGEAGSGKTHLLQALAQACAEQGLSVGCLNAASTLPWPFDSGWSLLILDDVHRFSMAQQQAAFALCVEAQSHGVAWAAAAPMPPVDLPLRDDLRTRLGWGQVHALQPLDEEQTREALGLEAERRGIRLSPEVVSYLMSRLSRDLASLMQLLERLDAYSLARARSVTVPLLREMLQAHAAPAPGSPAVNPLAGRPPDPEPAGSPP